ncbi:MAG: acetoin utilization protein AcuC [Steroidobacteraceae bacterium]
MNPTPANAGRPDRRVLVIADEATARYGFPDGHPFGPDRQAVFLRECRERGLHRRCLTTAEVRPATVAELTLFHTPRYVELVRRRSQEGRGSLDAGDTPAFPGCYEAACAVVGATLEAGRALMAGRAQRALVPIAGLHHAARDGAAGFCIFNDCGVLIELLRREAGLTRIAYVDIDAHHGDGVYYAFESDPGVIFADLHEDGHYLYPGTGHASENGLDAAAGLKLNLPLPPGADDACFAEQWPRVIEHLERHRPEFILLQCGTDSLGGDPITHLALTEASHARAAADLCRLADRLGHGRVLALGGGGYNRGNLARGWNAVLQALLDC